MVRLKHRYILVNILYPDTKTGTSSTTNGAGDIPYNVQLRRPTSDQFDAKILLRLIRQGVSDLFGDYGSGMVSASLQIKYFSPATSTAIVRVSRDHYRLVWAALTFTTRLPKPVDQPCVTQVVRVSGTIKKAEEEAIRRARLSIKQAQRSTSKTHSALLGASGLATIGVESMDADTDYMMGIEDHDEDDEEDEDD